jgi:hypothetical protein
MIPGTKHIVASMERAKYLLDFIDREPVMKWLLSRVEKARKVAEVEGLTTCDYGMGDYPAECFIFLMTSINGKSLNYVAGLDWGCICDPLLENWYISYQNEEDICIGETLNISKIISALKLSAHDVADAEVIYGIGEGSK